MKTGLITGVLACALVSPAHSETPTSSRPLVGSMGSNVTHFIAQHDDNADGKLEWVEFDAFRRHRFDATDTNRDGSVDIEEYVLEFKLRSGKALQESRAAQVEMTRTRFSALDADKDGRVSSHEFHVSGERMFTQGQATLAALDDGSDTALRQRSRSGLLPTSHTAEGFLALYDTNADGQVSRAEFDAHRSAQFTRTDSNRDGSLDMSEYLGEFESRLDARIAELQKMPDTQSRVRFRSLDKDKNGRMSFAEYQISGKRMFDAADRNHDGIVDTTDASLPEPSAKESRDIPHAGMGDVKRP